MGDDNQEVVTGGTENGGGGAENGAETTPEVEKPIMPDGLPADLQGIYRLMGYVDKNSYDDEKYEAEYAAAFALLIAAISNAE